MVQLIISLYYLIRATGLKTRPGYLPTFRLCRPQETGGGGTADVRVVRTVYVRQRQRRKNDQSSRRINGELSLCRYILTL